MESSDPRNGDKCIDAGDLYIVKMHKYYVILMFMKFSAEEFVDVDIFVHI